MRRKLSRSGLLLASIASAIAVLGTGAPAQASQSAPNCAAPSTTCAKYVSRVGSTSVQAPPAVAGVPPTLTASFTDRMDYPKLGAGGIPLSSMFYLDLRSFGGVNGVPAYLCAASQSSTTVAIEHTFDFNPSPLAFNASVGPVTGGFLAGPRTVKILTGDRQGCGAYYNAYLEVALSYGGFVGVTHTITVTSKLAGSATTTASFAEYVPFTQG